MAVTISGTQVTFNDGTVQSTEATLLGAVQYGAATSRDIGGFQSYSASSVYTGYVGPTGDNNSTSTTLMGDSRTTVFCGYQAYRTASSNTNTQTNDAGNDGIQDTGTIYSRVLYRSVSGA